MIEKEGVEFNKLKIATFKKVFEILMDKEVYILQREFKSNLNEVERHVVKLVDNAEEILLNAK